MKDTSHNQVRNAIKSAIAESGWTLTDVVKAMNEGRPDDEQLTTQNLSNKLTRQTLRYIEALQIAKIINCEIKWLKRNT